MSTIQTYAGRLRGLEWNDTAKAETTAADLLAHLAGDRTALRAAVEDTFADPHLRGLCEHYDILDKIVLHDDETGFRIRLHLFGSDHYDRPHNHRWTYSARLISADRQPHRLARKNEAVGEPRRDAAGRS